MYIIIFFLFFISSLYPQNFYQYKKIIDGELFLLRKKIESPQLENKIYDLFFREYHYFLKKGEAELYWDESYLNGKKININWKLYIPIEEQSYLHFKEAESLWFHKKFSEAIFIWKSLVKSQQKEISNRSSKILQEKLKQSSIKKIYKQIDPYFLYKLASNITYMYLDEYGIRFQLLEYWYYDLNDPIFSTMQKLDRKILKIYNSDFIIVMYLFKTKQNQIQNMQDVLVWMDWFLSWNSNTKGLYKFQRIPMENNLFFVNYQRENFVQYYEKIFIFFKGFCYLQIYSLKKQDQNFILNFIKEIGFQ